MSETSKRDAEDAVEDAIDRLVAATLAWDLTDDPTLFAKYRAARQEVRRAAPAASEQMDAPPAESYDTGFAHGVRFADQNLSGKDVALALKGRRTGAEELPELPERLDTMWRGRGSPRRWVDVYSADQMREYARAAVAQALKQRGTEALTDAARDVLAERRRQVEFEGWTPRHDDGHGDGSMAMAAAAYAVSSAGHHERSFFVVSLWAWTGWAQSWLKRKDQRSDLIRAGALILAEIERLDRAAVAMARKAGA